MSSRSKYNALNVVLVQLIWSTLFNCICQCWVHKSATHFLISPSSCGFISRKIGRVSLLRYAKAHEKVNLALDSTSNENCIGDDTQSQNQKNSIRKKYSYLGLITFDLDDTLFPVAPVIEDANNVLVQCMKEAGCDKVTAGDIIASTKIIRSELTKTDDVITYTELRKRAIQLELEKYNEQSNHCSSKESGVEYQQLVENIYAAWEKERHASAERHLYPDAIEMLQSLKSNNPNVKIGAITNGKGNPFEMNNTLSSFFDFCVSGEDDGVFPNRKPHRGIYDVALQRYEDLIAMVIDDKDDSYDENWCWVHVGDDLANDIGGSYICGAETIWADLKEEYRQTANKRMLQDSTSDDKQMQQQLKPSWSTASSEEIETRRKMGNEAKKCVSARIEYLSDLPCAVADILDGKINPLFKN